jgi:hypothetical protein
MLDEILQKINEPEAFNREITDFLTSRKQLINTLSLNENTSALQELLNEDACNFAKLQELLMIMGKNISNIKKVEQYNLG